MPVRNDPVRKLRQRRDALRAALAQVALTCAQGRWWNAIADAASPTVLARGRGRPATGRVSR